MSQPNPTPTPDTEGKQPLLELVKQIRLVLMANNGRTLNQMVGDADRFLEQIEAAVAALPDSATPPQAPDGELEQWLEDRLDIYPPTNGNCGVCGQRGYQHTCDQMFEAMMRELAAHDQALKRQLLEAVGEDEHASRDASKQQYPYIREKELHRNDLRAELRQAIDKVYGGGTVE